MDAAKFGLKVSRRTAEGWVFYDNLVPLPVEAYDTLARTVPDDLQVTGLPPRRGDSATVVGED